MRPGRRTALAVVVASVLVGLTGIGAAFALSQPKTMTITADFHETPGLYKDNHVEVLGIPVGTVTSITPHPTYVAVKMVVRADVAIPTSASALLEAPDVVNDRYIELNPPYTGGPRLVDGSVIPISHTAAPVSTDEILQNLDTLIRDLGPSGANKQGAVAQMIAELARVLGGNGQYLNESITSSGEALGALGQDGPQLTSLLDNLSKFTQSAAADSSEYKVFINDLAAVTDELAADDSAIGGALHNLQTALAALAQFVADNRTELGTAVGNLDTFFATLAKEQKALAGTINAAPTALTNITNAIDLHAPGGPALVSRYDPTTGATTVVNQVCGNTLLRLLIVTVGDPAKATPLDVVCGFSSVIENLGTPPDAPSGPTTSLQTLTGKS